MSAPAYDADGDDDSPRDHVVPVHSPPVNYHSAINQDTGVTGAVAVEAGEHATIPLYVADVDHDGDDARAFHGVWASDRIIMDLGDCR